MAISKDAIVAAAIGILNREGEEALSMRTLAAALDIKAASLYNHVSGKQDLYGAIAEYMCTGCDMPDTGLPPKDYLMAISRAYRAMLLKVRDSTVIFKNSLPDTPNRGTIIRNAAERLSALGVEKDKLMTIFNTFNNYILSYVADECRYKNTPPERIAEFMNLLDPEDKILYVNSGDFDEQFDYGLMVFFAGLDAAAKTKGDSNGRSNRHEPGHAGRVHR